MPRARKQTITNFGFDKNGNITNPLYTLKALKGFRRLANKKGGLSQKDHTYLNTIIDIIDRAPETIEERETKKWHVNIMNRYF